jgi:hypothetical protein
MGELINYSEIAFIEHFCRHGSMVLGIIVGIGLITLGVHKIMEIRKRK